MSRKLFEELVSGYYILYFNDRLVVTNKLYREFATPPLKPAEIIEAIEVIRNEVKTLSDKTKPLTPDQCFPTILPPVSSNIPAVQPGVSPFMQFIQDCQVPEKAKTRDGFYRINLYSQPAEKAFMKILKDGYQLDILVAATKLYYKSGGYLKTISNFIIEGVWMGCYTEMAISLKDGTIGAHITKKLDNREDEDGHTRYKR